MDKISKERRSWIMGRIKSIDTQPYLWVRSLLHRNGYRYRLHVKSLPGKPDIVLPKYKIIVDIRGCFWHLHKGCPQARIPSTRNGWWMEKLNKNVGRDNENLAELKSQGWRILVIWGCVFKGIRKEHWTTIQSFLLKSLLFLQQSHDSSCIEIDRNIFDIR